MTTHNENVLAKLAEFGFTKGPDEIDSALICRALDELTRDRRMLIADKLALRADRDQLCEALQNMMGAFDTPLRRLRMPGEFQDEAIASARAALAGDTRE